jgi:RNA polymerase sigma-70 factor (ECF subfamily)
MMDMEQRVVTILLSGRPGGLPVNSVICDCRLSQLATLWSVVCQAHQGPEDAMRSARQRLLERYGGVVHRYLLGALREPDAADELFQEFALHFLRGDFRRADPERGRFRNFLKTALFRLVVHYRRRRQKQPLPLRDDAIEVGVAEPQPVEVSEQDFLRCCRDEYLARAWNALEQIQASTGQPFYAVLRFRADNPDMPSPEMAETLSLRLGRPLTSAGVRQLLHRARERFADTLLEDVAQSLDQPTEEHLEEELIELQLLDYCRPALQRRRCGGEAA